MTQKLEPWQIEAQRRSDAKDRLSDRADDGGVLASAEVTDPEQNMSAATRAAIAAYAASNQPGTGGLTARAVASSDRVSLKDAGDALIKTAGLPAEHVDRVKAVKDWDDARSRGDSLSDVRTDSSQRVQRTDSRADAAEPDSINAGGLHPEGKLVVTPTGNRGRWVFDSKYGGQVFYPEDRS